MAIQHDSSEGPRSGKPASCASFGFSGPRTWAAVLLVALVIVLALSGAVGGAVAASIPAPNSSSWQLNGSASIDGGGSLVLTSGTGSQGGSAFYKTPISVGTVTVSFDLTFSGGSAPPADGVTVDLLDASGQSPTALGVGGGSLGFEGLSGTGVAFDDYLNNGCDPSSNFVAIIDGSGCNATDGISLHHLATSTSIPALYGHTTRVTVFSHGATSTVKVWVAGVLTRIVGLALREYAQLAAVGERRRSAWLRVFTFDRCADSAHSSLGLWCASGALSDGSRMHR